MRTFLIPLASLAMLSSCSTVTPGPDAGLPRVSQPVFEDVALTGLAIRQERVAGSSTSFTSGRSYARATTVSGPYSASAQAHGSYSAVKNSTHYELFDSDEVLEDLRRRVENAGICRRVTPDADLRIEGRRVRAGSTTGAGAMLWDIFNCVSLLGLIGTPCVGSVDAEVELRVYFRDELIGTYRGVGTADWSHSMYGIIPGVPRMRRESINVATGLAARSALRELVDSPPALPLERGSGPADDGRVAAASAR